MTSVLLHNNCATMIRLLSRSSSERLSRGDKAPAIPVCDLFRAAINQLYRRRSPFSHSVSLSLQLSRRMKNHSVPHFSQRYHQLVAKRCTLQLKKETRNSRAHWLREQSCASLFATLCYQQKEGKGGVVGRARLLQILSSPAIRHIACDRSDDRLFSPLRDSFTCSVRIFCESASQTIFYCFPID